MDDKPVNYSEKRYKEIKDEHLSLVGEEKRGGPKAALKLFKQVDEKSVVPTAKILQMVQNN